MTPVSILIAKELRCFLVSPVFYVVGAVFLFVVGLLAHLAVVNAGQQAVRIMQIQNSAAQLNLNELVFRQMFASMEIILMFVLPMLTMRLFAEERKLHTFEFLLTSPIEVHEIISAKYLSVFLIYIGLVTLTGLTPLVLSLYSSFEWSPVLTGYLALMLQGGLFLAIGVLASTMTENQIVAAFISFGIILVLWLLGGLGHLLGDSLFGHTLTYLSFTDHYDRLVRSLLDVKDLVYYVSASVLMLFIAHRIVDSHRWS
ncbi:MAG: ABC transporter permease subunit [Nitrospirales bacterium]|nr:ABC transporter permease subunit [Nitrospirales bacterium]